MLEGLRNPSGLRTLHSPTGGDGRCAGREYIWASLFWQRDPNKQHKMDGGKLSF